MIQVYLNTFQFSMNTRQRNIRTESLISMMIIRSRLVLKAVPLLSGFCYRPDFHSLVGIHSYNSHNFFQGSFEIINVKNIYFPTYFFEVPTWSHKIKKYIFTFCPHPSPVIGVLTGLILVTYCMWYPYVVPFWRNQIPYTPLKPPKPQGF